MTLMLVFGAFFSLLVAFFPGSQVFVYEVLITLYIVNFTYKLKGLNHIT